MISKYTKHGICLGFIVLFWVNLYAQHPSYFSLTTNDGLPSNTVYFMHQDSLGFLWLATENGLCRYNGRDFKYFDHSMLKDSDIIGLYSDNTGRIWLWNISGQLAYVQNDSIKIYPFKGILNKSKIVGFKIDLKGNFWVAVYRKGVWKYNPQTHNSKQIINSTNHTIEVDKVGNIYLDRFYLERANGSSTHINNPFYRIKQTKLGRLFYYNIVGKEIIEITDNTYSALIPKEYPLAQSLVTNIFEDNQKTLWMTTAKQLFGIQKDGTWLNNGQSFFSDIPINYFLQDLEGNYWLAVNDEGIRIYPSFDVLTYNQYNSNLQGKSVLSIASNQKGSILIGQEKGKASFLKNNKFLHHQFNTEFDIKTILTLKNNKFWIAPKELMDIDDQFNISNKLDTSKLSLVYRLYKPKAFFEDTINLNRYSGHFWGIYRNNIINNNIKKTFNVVNTSSHSRTYAIAKDYPKDQIWFGKVDGLYQLGNEKVIRNASITPFLISSLKKQPWVSQIIFGENNNMWVGTYDQGVLWLKDGKLFKHYNEKTGLVNNHCNALIIEKNIVWVGTKKGINRINIQNDQIDLINKLDGLPNNEIKALHQINHTMYVGTSSGLTVFDKRKIQKNSKIPTTLITAIKIMEQDTTLHSSYTLNYQQNNIQIAFTGLNYRSHGTSKYKYRMLGTNTDTTWRITSSNFVSFPILATDNYTFQVIAINEDGIESKTPASIKFYITPPFWRTLWFNAVLVLGLSSFMFGVFYLWFQQYRQKIQLQDELNQKVTILTMKALQAQMNPHFVFNALNGILRFILSGEKKEAMTYLSKFARLIRLIFEYSKISEISLSNELEFLNLYLELEAFRFKGKIDISLTINTKVSEDSIYIPPLLVQPIIENSFKHGLMHKKKGGILKINFEQCPNNILKCTIEDNGVGRKKAANLAKWKPKEYRSSGLKTTKSRLELLTQRLDKPLSSYFNIIDLKDEEQKAIGTKFELLIPFGKQ